ncbi:unnamed protein product [Phaeothamnion confervicola]
MLRCAYRNAWQECSLAVSRTLMTRKSSLPTPVESVLRNARAASLSSSRRFELEEEDLEEKFIKGSGPGGQKINKVRNRVQLVHRPTGIAVSCQEARSLTANRSIARGWLRDKVEVHLQGANSRIGRRIERARKKKDRGRRRALGRAAGADGICVGIGANDGGDGGAGLEREIDGRHEVGDDDEEGYSGRERLAVAGSCGSSDGESNKPAEPGHLTERDPFRARHGGPLG